MTSGNSTNQSTKLNVSCPTCSKSVAWAETSPFRPFCSSRCRLIDLGEWANEEKVIPGENLPSAVNSEVDKEDDNW